MASEVDNLRQQLKAFQAKYQKEAAVSRELALRLQSAKAEASSARAEADALRRPVDAAAATSGAGGSRAGGAGGAGDDGGEGGGSRSRPAGSSLFLPHTGAATDALVAHIDRAAAMHALEEEVASLRRVLAAVAAGKLLHEAVRWEITFAFAPTALQDFCTALGLADALVPYPYVPPHRVPLIDAFVIVGPCYEAGVEAVKQRYSRRRHVAAARSPRDRVGGGGSGMSGGGGGGGGIDGGVEVEEEGFDAVDESLESAEPDVLFVHPPHTRLPSSSIPYFAYPQGMQLREWDPELLHRVFDSPGSTVATGGSGITGSSSPVRGKPAPVFIPPLSPTGGGSDVGVAGMAARVGALFAKRGLRRGPRSHVFVLQGTDYDDAELSAATGAAIAAGRLVEGRTRYGMCLQVSEPLTRSTALGYAHRAHVAGAEMHGSGVEEDVGVSLPRVLVCISRYPFFPLHFEFLRAVAAMWQHHCARRLRRIVKAGYAPLPTAPTFRAGMPDSGSPRIASTPMAEWVAPGVTPPSASTTQAPVAPAAAPPTEETRSASPTMPPPCPHPPSATSAPSTSLGSSMWKGAVSMWSKAGTVATGNGGGAAGGVGSGAPPPATNAPSSLANMLSSLTKSVSATTPSGSVSSGGSSATLPSHSPASSTDAFPAGRGGSAESAAAIMAVANGTPFTNVEDGSERGHTPAVSATTLTAMFHRTTSKKAASSGGGSGGGMGSMMASLLSPGSAPAPAPAPTSHGAGGGAEGGSGASTSLATLFGGVNLRTLASGSGLQVLTSPFSLNRVRRSSEGEGVGGGDGGSSSAITMPTSGATSTHPAHVSTVTTEDAAGGDLALTDDVTAAACAAMASALMPPALHRLVEQYAALPVPSLGETCTFPLPRHAVPPLQHGTGILHLLPATSGRGERMDDSSDDEGEGEGSPAAELRYLRDAVGTGWGMPPALKPPSDADMAATAIAVAAGSDGVLEVTSTIASSVLASIEADCAIKQASMAASHGSALVAPVGEGGKGGGHDALIWDLVSTAPSALAITAPSAPDGPHEASGEGDREGVVDAHDASGPVLPWQVGCDLDHAETSVRVSQWAAPILFSMLPIDSILLLLGAALVEQKIIFVGGRMSQEVVSSCVLALASLLRPLSWVGPLLPTVPPHLHDLLHAPIPVMLGVPSLPADFEQDEQTVIVLLDRETVRIPAVRTTRHGGREGDDDDGDGIHLLPNFLALQLPDNSVLYNRLEPLARPLRVGSGSGSGRTVAHNKVRPCYKPTPAQVTASCAIVQALNAHVRRLLYRLFSAGAAGMKVAARGVPEASGGNSAWSAAVVKQLPSFQTCAAALLERVPEVEAPFWTQFLGSQSVSYFYDTRLMQLQAAALMRQPKVGRPPHTWPTSPSWTSTPRRSLAAWSGEGAPTSPSPTLTSPRPASTVTSPPPDLSFAAAAAGATDARLVRTLRPLAAGGAVTAGATAVAGGGGGALPLPPIMNPSLASRRASTGLVTGTLRYGTMAPIGPGNGGGEAWAPLSRRASLGMAMLGRVPPPAATATVGIASKEALHRDRAQRKASAVAGGRGRRVPASNLAMASDTPDAGEGADTSAGSSPDPSPEVMAATVTVASVGTAGASHDGVGKEGEGEGEGEGEVGGVALTSRHRRRHTAAFIPAARHGNMGASLLAGGGGQVQPQMRVTGLAGTALNTGLPPLPGDWRSGRAPRDATLRPIASSITDDEDGDEDGEGVDYAWRGVGVGGGGEGDSSEAESTGSRPRVRASPRPLPSVLPPVMPTRAHGRHRSTTSIPVPGGGTATGDSGAITAGDVVIDADTAMQAALVEARDGWQAATAARRMTLGGGPSPRAR